MLKFVNSKRLQRVSVLALLFVVSLVGCEDPSNAAKGKIETDSRYASQVTSDNSSASAISFSCNEVVVSSEIACAANFASLPAVKGLFAISGSEKILAADFMSVKLVSANGETSTLASGLTSLNKIANVVSAADSLYLHSVNSSKFFRLSPGGALTLLADLTPASIVAMTASRGTVYIATSTNKIFTFSSTTQTLSPFPFQNQTGHFINGIRGLAVHDERGLFLADQQEIFLIRNGQANHVTGVPTTAPLSNGSLDEASFENIVGIAVDQEGRVYVADQADLAQIRRVELDESRVITISILSGPAAAGCSCPFQIMPLQGPMSGITVLKRDNFTEVFLAHGDRRTISRIQVAD